MLCDIDEGGGFFGLVCLSECYESLFSEPHPNFSASYTIGFRLHAAVAIHAKSRSPRCGISLPSEAQVLSDVRATFYTSLTDIRVSVAICTG
jgi:hypothetical protein